MRTASITRTLQPLRTVATWSETLSEPRKRAGRIKRAVLKPAYHDPKKIGCPRTALAAIAAHLPALTKPGLAFGKQTPAEPAGAGLLVMGYFTLGIEGEALLRDAYAYGWVRDFDWMTWSHTREAKRLLRDPTGLLQADAEDLAMVLTVCMREAHWGREALDQRFREGLLTRVLKRAVVLLAAMPGDTGPNGPHQRVVWCN